MTDHLDKRLQARKALYEKQKQARTARLEARRAQYERRKQARTTSGLSIGISSVRRGVEPQRWTVRHPSRVSGEVIKPEIEEREPLVDIFNEEDYLRIDIQLSNIYLPEDTAIDEITEISFRHGVLEIKLRKRKEMPSREEKEVLVHSEEERVTAEVKKKIMLMLRKGVSAEEHYAD